MRQKLGGKGRWLDLGPARATSAIPSGGTTIEAAATRDREQPTRLRYWVPRKDTPRARQAANEANERGSVAAAAVSLGISRQRANQLVRRG